MTAREIEKQLKALANRRRLAILAFLQKEREAPVGEIAREIRLSFKSTSRHLAVLSNLDMLEKDQRSVQVFYRIAKNQTSLAQHVLSLL